MIESPPRVCNCAMRPLIYLAADNTELPHYPLNQLRDNVASIAGKLGNNNGNRIAHPVSNHQLAALTVEMKG
jgi:hypothetical protein